METQEEKPRGRPMIACTRMGLANDGDDFLIATIEQVRRLFPGEELDVVRREDDGFDVYKIWLQSGAK